MEDLVTCKLSSRQSVTMKTSLRLAHGQIQTFVIKLSHNPFCKLLKPPALCPFRSSNKHLTRTHSLEADAMVF